MGKKDLMVNAENIGDYIYFIRGQKVMLDEDLAMLYGVLTKRLNEQVRRNIDRFPEDFAFQLTKNEWGNLKFQIGTSSSKYNSLKSQNETLEESNILISQNVISSSEWGSRRKLPFAFTEQGVAMLSGVFLTNKIITQIRGEIYEK